MKIKKDEMNIEAPCQVRTVTHTILLLPPPTTTRVNGHSFTTTFT